MMMRMTEQQQEIPSVPSLLVDLYQVAVAVHEAVRSQGNALGACSMCVSEWLDQGAPQGRQVPMAVMWALVGPGTTVPLCVPHFSAVRKLQSTPQLIQAGPGDVPTGGPGLIVPGR